MTGTVKWFDQDKGYGFITCDGSHPDVFVHHSAIVDQRGRRNLIEHQRVEFRVEQGDKGPKAVDVRSYVEDVNAGGATASTQHATHDT